MSNQYAIHLKLNKMLKPSYVSDIGHGYRNMMCRKTQIPFGGVGGERVAFGNSLLSVSFFCKPKTALKHKVCILKRI